ncbi:hypothetical protein HaLaN_05303 [Haematococcus lacustris]|uniref:Uncharacterized protein n=1 Tax=Haematococcus lacustris TaxID=44745 RepID=A0A699YSZ3_HAELA|nr:hypothetical protein HaLaN_05303 [Haematococcus lacustris]
MKYFLKLEAKRLSDKDEQVHIPPPRPKRRSLHPAARGPASSDPRGAAHQLALMPDLHLASSKQQMDVAVVAHTAAAAAAAAAAGVIAAAGRVSSLVRQAGQSTAGCSAQGQPLIPRCPSWVRTCGSW